ncbi:MAG: LysR family transcriptional regulator [Burkholderiaceae bacterium]|nr:LysR family transcriptional regulator [Burkholderiaceae bacterium]
MNVSIRQLRAFVALCELRNFTRAAEACHLSQPAFSALIRQLEQTVGSPLFDRSTRHVEASAEGREFEPGARRVLAELEAALGAVQARASLRRGRVSIALLPSLAAGWLPQVLAGFRDRHPGIELQVADLLSEPCIARVRSGEADFALAATRAETPELRAEIFCSDDFHLVCRRDHPLARQHDPQPADLAGFPFVHLSRTSSVRQYVDAATHPNPLPPALEVDQLATVAGMVRAGIGISVVPALTLYQFRAAELVTRALRWPGLERSLYLVARRDRALSFAATAFYDWVMARRPQAGRPQTRPGGD